MGGALAVRNEYRLHEWAKIVEECSKSGMSNREYCTERGISEKKYYYWLREAAAESMRPHLVEVKLDSNGVQNEALSMRYQGAELIITSSTPSAALDKALHALKKL